VEVQPCNYWAQALEANIAFPDTRKWQQSLKRPPEE
jgi:hypothetical protein